MDRLLLRLTGSHQPLELLDGLWQLGAQIRAQIGRSPFQLLPSGTHLRSSIAPRLAGRNTGEPLGSTAKTLRDSIGIGARLKGLGN
jgi:hypothetical protein